MFTEHKESRPELLVALELWNSPCSPNLKWSHWSQIKLFQEEYEGEEMRSVSDLVRMIPLATHQTIIEKDSTW